MWQFYNVFTVQCVLPVFEEESRQEMGDKVSKEVESGHLGSDKQIALDPYRNPNANQLSWVE